MKQLQAVLNLDVQTNIGMVYPHINARYVSQKITREVLSRNIQGCVESIFNNSFNIETGEGFLINIGKEGLPLGPRSILLSREDLYQKIFPKISLGVFFSTLNGSLYFPEIGISISFQEATQFNPKGNPLSGNLPKKKIERNLIAAAKCFQRGRKTIQGIDYSPLSDYFFSRVGFVASPGYQNEGMALKVPKKKDFFCGPNPKFWQRIDSLIYAIQNSSWDEVDNVLRNIVGFGPGLTPSGDDFLCGFIAAGKVVSRVKESISGLVNKIIDRVSKQANGKTTKVSISMIEDVCSGEMADPVWKFIQTSLLSEEMSKIEFSCDELKKIGGSSGEDLFNGLATGIWFFVSID